MNAQGSQLTHQMKLCATNMWERNSNNFELEVEWIKEQYKISGSPRVYLYRIKCELTAILIPSRQGIVPAVQVFLRIVVVKYSVLQVSLQL